MTEQFVSIERQEAVTTVTMHRPEVHNAFNEHVIAQLRDAFAAIQEDAQTRVVVVAGEGRSFSAGADLDWMRRASELSEEENRRDGAALAAMLRSVADCPRPVVAGVQGAALGGGAGLVAAADIVVAGASARFGFPETRRGLVPATIAPHVIEKIGRGWALRLFLTGERFDAARAASLGLVYRVVPDDQLGSAIQEITNALVAGGPEALRVSKQLVRRVADEPAGADAYTADLIARLRSSAEGREGVRAFLEKRAPSWTQPDDS